MANYYKAGVGQVENIAQEVIKEDFKKAANKNGSDRAAINRLLTNNQYNQVNMRSPNNRVESDIGEIRTRYTSRNVKGA